MNRIFKCIWNRTLGRWVVAHEFAKSRGKKSASMKLIVISVAGSMILLTNANSESAKITDDITNHGIGVNIVGENGSNGRNGALFVTPSAGKHGESVGTDLTISDKDGISVNTTTGEIILKYEDGKGNFITYKLTPNKFIEEEPTVGNSNPDSTKKPDMSSYDVSRSMNGADFVKLGKGVESEVTYKENDRFQVTIEEYGLTMDFTPDPDDPVEIGAKPTKVEPVIYQLDGNGKTITLDSNFVLDEKSKIPAAVYVTTTGGRGGKGGSYTLGGSGRTGGEGGDGGNIKLYVDNITIKVDSKIPTVGVFAKSTGGNGGKGGNSNLAINEHGGSGAIGGIGGDVSVSVDNAKIIMRGDRNVGVLGVSEGGGSGDGGSSIGILSAGGKSESAGAGGNVEIKTDDKTTIEMNGNWSTGIMAQSVGGSGGKGGLSIDVVSIGGHGGVGGNAGKIDIDNQSNITIQGENAIGIIGQSLGGGGGNSGLAAGLVILGSQAGSGGDASEVTIQNSGLIKAIGKGGHGILAQSIGGGGGNTGMAAGLVRLGGGYKRDKDGEKIGGAGAGGAAGEVVVKSMGEYILTQGDDAQGILAQSIGGGGGNGGGNTAVFTLGADEGGKGGEAGTVRVENSSMILTGADGIESNRASAIIAQSIGGGGGNGSTVTGVGPVTLNIGAKGGKGGSADSVTVSNKGTQNKSIVLATNGDHSSAVVAQSVGGNGGNASSMQSLGSSIALNFGGAGADGGNAGIVLVENDYSDIVTQGDLSMGILAQSIGGDGGQGSSIMQAGASHAISVNLSFAGDGGKGGNANKVEVKSNNGAIVTFGKSSTGILAQSIGGDGGNGGSVISGSLSLGLSANIAIGGKGNTGGKSSKVLIENSSDVLTSGENSSALVAQSIGGSGGKGGTTVAAGVASLGAVNISMSGKGGKGGIADSVRIDNTGNLITSADNSTAVLAQSIGGNGGDSGLAFSGGLSGAFSAGVSISGDGGTGGTSGSVNVRLGNEKDIERKYISTTGNNAKGVLAQSIGGTGGNAGTALSTNASLGLLTGTISLALAKDGGQGGAAKEVSITSHQNIVTKGSHSGALVAQSIGGNGGAGGVSLSGSLSAAVEGPSLAASVAVGGDGGIGGEASKVVVDSYGGLMTQGDFSDGILAQSIGGNGGIGGMSLTANISGSSQLSGSASVSLGGKGGKGASSNNVSVTAHDIIITQGEYSSAITAQSIGGSGGKGGMSIGTSVLLSAGSAVNLSVGIGGEGGEGGKSGKVNVNNQANLSTKGNGSIGILAQSLGGGGGHAGNSVNGSVTVSKATNFNAGVRLGGDGGKGGIAGMVDLLNTHSRIITEGHSASAIVGQSIGGSGGVGGSVFSAVLGVALEGKPVDIVANIGGDGGAGGEASEVKIISDNKTLLETKNKEGQILPTISTSGDLSHGILAQSIGGNGGQAGATGNISILASGDNQPIKLGVSLGGAGGDGSKAGKVTVTSFDNIVTEGHGSSGIYAQSIGGAGGDGGWGLNFNLTAGINPSSSSINADVTLGGKGGTGNRAGEVMIVSSGIIQTLGDHSQGVLAQSIGGSGGNGGMAMSIGATMKGTNVNVAVGGKGGASDQSSKVEVIRTGNIQTSGHFSAGILVQSISGDGGNGGSSIAGSGSLMNSNNISLSVGGNGGSFKKPEDPSQKAAGAVIVKNIGHILTEKNNSRAIVAQSIGGNGGNGGISGSLGVSGISTESKWSVSASIGGRGGEGLASSTVNVSNEGSLLTVGGYSQGILAQSIGGGGGNGGMSLSGTFNVDGLGPKGKSNTLNVAVGGAGGSGNTSDEVSVYQNGYIETQGIGSAGIQAQSIGGGGGNGGNASSERLTIACVTGCIPLISKSKGTNLALSVGGWGGSGNNAAKVNVKQQGNIVTSGQSAHGIYAQSIGGGGGDGGSALLDLDNFKVLSQETKEDAGLSVGIGGYKGAAGNGEEVNILSAGSIETKGDFAKGILAQSIGGGGGNGGNVDGGLLGIGGGAFQHEISLLFDKDFIPQGILDGEHSGASGNAGKVIISTGKFAGIDLLQNDEPTIIMTAGNNSDAIFAQSIGGGGGIGGTAGSKLALGGDGGLGGNGSQIDIKNDNVLVTNGSFSSGIFAQSIGGGGGTGGGATDALIAIGGAGDSGGNGDKVDITNLKSIYTEGIASRGIYAQSIGGSGGNGGGVDQAKVAIGGGAFASILSEKTAMKDKGIGGTSGEVIINNLTHSTYNLISTKHSQSDAVMAQSIGGGGGTGGSASGLLAIGGFASAAGDGNNVTIKNNFTLWTEGVQSNGIIAQSIGGGGGIGGGVISGQTDTTVVAIGGNGAHAGHGKEINITNSGAIITEGELSRGIVAQSIGGGGGIGGYIDEGDTNIVETARDIITGLGSNVLSQAESAIENFLLNDKAAGGNGGQVNIINGELQSENSQIFTKGNGSDAILAQSIAGGGGASGSMKGVFIAGASGAAKGDSDAVTVKNFGLLNTKGQRANGIVAQSISSGGGISGGSTADIKSQRTIIGAAGSVAGISGEVSVENHGLVMVEGIFSQGIIAQSIAGGGAIVGATESAQLGSKSSQENHAGKITITNKGDLFTFEQGSSAIVAQSIGGGGGYISGAKEIEWVKGVGDAGEIQVNNESEYIYTKGAFSHGILAQSLAGGGGYVNVIDTDDNLIGYQGKSSGGSGASGNVNITHKGHILTEGAGSIGILVQSQGQESGTINVDIKEGSSIIGGIGSGSAIALAGGGSNTVNNAGLLTSLGDKSAHILSDHKDENGLWQFINIGWIDGSILKSEMGQNNTLNNEGHMAGSIEIKGANNSVNNRADAWFLSGNFIDLQQLSGVFNNQGNFAIGSIDQVSHTQLTGDFKQDEQGIFYWDYDLDRNSKMAVSTRQQRLIGEDVRLDHSQVTSIGSYDLLEVAGDVTLNGDLHINMRNLGKATPGVSDQVLVRANSVVDEGIKLHSIPSAVITFDKVVTHNSLIARSHIDYSRYGLTDNGHRLGDAINSIQLDQKYPGFDPISAALVVQKDMKQLQGAYDSIMGEGAIGIMQSAFSYSDRMMKMMRKQSGDWLSSARSQQNSAYNAACEQDIDTTICETDRFRGWLTYSHWSEDIKSDAKIGSAAYHGKPSLTVMGFDYQLDETTLLGVAFGHGVTNYHVTDRATTGHFKSHGIGIYGVKSLDKTYLKASIGYDTFRGDISRFAMIQGTNDTYTPVATIANDLKSKFKGSVWNMGVEFGSRIEVGNDLHLSPFIGLQASMLKQKSSVEESIKGGDSTLALRYHSKTAYSVPVFIGVQIDKNIYAKSGILQTYARATVMHDFSNKRELTASFNAAPDYDFTTRGVAAKRYNISLDLGFKMMPTKSLEIYGELNGVYGGKTKKEGLSVGVTYNW